jgi:hypothetical protein
MGEKTKDYELVCVALNGFSKSWNIFVHGVVAREKLPEWQCLWDDFVQEEIRLGHSSGSSSSPHVVDKEGLALASKGKGKKKKGGKKDIDFSKVKCFQCHKMGHVASQCPEKKKKNKPQMATFVEVEEFAKIFEEEFWFIASMASSTISDIWFVDSGASCHMTARKEFFRRLQEGGVNLHIELRDDRHYKAQGVGIVTFQRESSMLFFFI